MTRPDPIAFELFKNALFSIADEMALTIFERQHQHPPAAVTPSVAPSL